MKRKDLVTTVEIADAIIYHRTIINLVIIKFVLDGIFIALKYIGKWWLTL